MNWIYIVLIINLTLFLTACGDSGNNGEASYLLPPMYISCGQAYADDCKLSNVGKPFFIGITSNTNITCEVELEKVRAGNLDLYFDFYGSSTTTYAGEMTGEVTQWYDTENQQSYYMQNISYKACAFFDIDDDGRLDPTEPVGELLFDANDKLPSIIDWQ